VNDRSQIFRAEGSLFIRKLNGFKQAILAILFIRDKKKPPAIRRLLQAMRKLAVGGGFEPPRGSWQKCKV